MCDSYNFVNILLTTYYILIIVTFIVRGTRIAKIALC